MPEPAVPCGAVFYHSSLIHHPGDVCKRLAVRSGSAELRALLDDSELIDKLPLVARAILSS